ncbi:MAG TPA: hypothetical protein VJZ71_13370 [Phycisphaerae bacterium]|nr:hypothetical protein [Phycisphaerae bacterium]
MDVLTRIKGLILRQRYRFSEKAADELDADGLQEADVLESIMNADHIKKTIRSSAHTGEKLYVIESPDYHGTLIYTKGKFTKLEDEEIFYFLISSKRSRRGNEV